jgi:shikimate dehydrogenase
MRKFGLIGYPLTHSFSRAYFMDVFQQEVINAAYFNFPLEKIEDILPLFKDPQLEGLNVTIPYKESVIAYLDEISDAVREIGACNCIRINGGKLSGFNTDVIGFERTWERKLTSVHRKAMVLGTGGAAKAVWYVLNKRKIPFLKISRTADPENNQLAYGSLTPDLVREHTLIINTTPLGMYPHVDSYPEIPYEAITKDHYLYDLVYNPGQTVFLKKGAAQGAITENGRDMLIIQADESRKIWEI